MEKIILNGNIEIKYEEKNDYKINHNDRGNLKDIFFDQIISNFLGFEINYDQPLEFINMIEKIMEIIDHLGEKFHGKLRILPGHTNNLKYKGNILFNNEKKEQIKQELKMEGEYKNNFVENLSLTIEIYEREIINCLEVRLGDDFQNYESKINELGQSKLSGLFGFTHVYGLEKQEILKYIDLLKSGKMEGFYRHFRISNLGNLQNEIYFGRPSLLEILVNNLDTFLVDLAIDIVKCRLDQKITYFKEGKEDKEGKYRCYYCGLNYGLFYCNIDGHKKSLKENPKDNKCLECKQQIFESKKSCIHYFINSNLKCDCKQKNIEHIKHVFDNQDLDHYINTDKKPFLKFCNKCNIDRDIVSRDSNKTELKKWIKQFGQIARNYYIQVQIILVFAIPSVFLNPDSNLSIFTDFAEYIELILASNTFFLVWNVIVLFITTIVSFCYIARESKEAEFIKLKFDNSASSIRNNINLKYKYENTILCCAPDLYSDEYVKIAEKIKLIRNKTQSRGLFADYEIIKDCLLRKKELNHDALISKVLMFLVVFSLPTLIYIIYVMINERIFTFVGFLFIVGKIRATWKVIKIIDILSRINTCCSWENKKSIEDEEKIATNETEPEFV